MAEVQVEDFSPRNYQVALTNIGRNQNTIVFLPTGSGKTFIALMILKQMCSSILKSYGDGGKVTVILVNTVALVEQHGKYVKDHTNFTVGQYTGEMNLDFWPRDKWYDEFNKYQVLILTTQIFVNLVNNRYMDLNKVNLLIFDECHHGVNDHAMRQLMKNFGNLVEPPRVLGLTATLLNGNCKPTKVMQEVQTLETTYHSKVATVDGLDVVVGYSTNPREGFKINLEPKSSYVDGIAINILQKTIAVIIKVKPEPVVLNLKCLTPLDSAVGYKRLSNLVTDLIEQIEVMGTFGGIKATLAHTIQTERLRKHCQDLNLYHLLSFVVTTFSFVKELLSNHIKDVSEKDQIYKFSSNKVLQLIEILREYKKISQEELCCIIFTERRFTAKVVYHILDALRTFDPEFSDLKPNFIVGVNNNPYNDTRENLYCTKKNKQVLQSFINKEINILVASNVLEEGVDIPKCTLVIKFDYPKDYRSYIQSKGRARHKSSLYYIIIDKTHVPKFMERYQEFQLVEQTLNDYLIGKNLSRLEPSEKDIEKMYNEDELPPYYVDGPGSAQVNMLSAIPLLCQYCASLPSDIYTTYAPEWYIDKKVENGNQLNRVIIMLPTICPIVDIIEGDYMSNIKSAKRAAALKACILLHKIGELDDHLLPRKNMIPEQDVSFLFTHYPKIKENNAGSGKMKRLHEKKISLYVQGQMKPNIPQFLHIIVLQPRFKKSEDINNSTIYDMYTSPLCFGILTSKPIPVLCDFPIYVSLGTINVKLQVNANQIVLQATDIEAIKKFHYAVFDDVLKVLQPFLIFDNSEEAEMLLVVPVDATTHTIDFNIIKEHEDVKNILELSREEKLNLEVTQETYLRKIVAPWYRREPATYIVTEVSLNKCALSPFPNEDFGSFKDYFQEKHNQKILNVQQPLLLVKGLTKRLNFIKPKGVEGKRKRDKIYEEMTEYLIPELVVKQEFPAALWIQASFLPTILYRISYILQLEELRCKIFKEAGLGKEVIVQNALQLDEYLLDYVPNIEEQLPDNITIVAPSPVEDLTLPQTLLQYNKDYAAKVLEAEYPWADIEEPKDIERDINVSLTDIEYYENFISQRADMNKVSKIESPIKTNHKQLALTYYKDFVEKPIELLNKPFSGDGPELSDMYRALTAAKANDIVNLERLETLGDSFLKLISSVYISLRFPSYDEGRATALKGRLVSNKNLYYLAKKNNLSGIMKFKELSPKDEWLPPAFKIPDEIMYRISLKELSVNALFNLNIPMEEQISGVLSEDTLNSIQEDDCPPDENEESSYNNMATFLKCQYMGDKHVADVVESLLGAYFKCNGFIGGIKFIEWMKIIPASENFLHLLNVPAPDPLIDKNARQDKIIFHIPCWQQIEEILGYHFTNRAYLLQALTHSSYTQNRVTLSYEKLEFLGDAVLDFLITCHIYESCGNLNPGELTDLRSALVNNNTFASLVVRCGFHKFLLMMNSKLQGHIDKFVEYLRAKNFEIDDEVLILLEENELVLSEYVDVPKVLGDIFEALAGAIYLDSGKDLKVVWKVFYKIMWKEIDLFSKNVPKNAVRRLFEWTGTYPKFGEKIPTDNKKCIIPLQFMLNGRQKLVHGCGSNKVAAKKAAAKLALRFLEK